ncbi:hypothetical protein [Escherichia coli]|uniref:hypothetical protein n=1 Tax=Escherichia coli TaxID=562 RepID=UPI0021D43FC3|nr:hypothetical protein [Escherichia coli]
MVQRYENDHGDMFQVAGGNWVRYEDYAELERKLRNFADQVLYAPCSKVTEEMAMEILGI